MRHGRATSPAPVARTGFAVSGRPGGFIACLLGDSVSFTPGGTLLLRNQGDKGARWGGRYLGLVT